MLESETKTSQLTQTELQQLRANCTRFLSGHYPTRPHEIFRELAEFTSPEIIADRYGTGLVIEEFEAEVATLLGKEAAVFMPSGTMAQVIALNIWAERSGIRNLAFHPTCHLELHESKAYQKLYNLHSVLIGSPDTLIKLDDLKKVREPLAALLLELPQREIGGQLPSWEELQAIIQWAQSRKIALHLDGARLWECQPFYQREYAEITAAFDTVYVSFYKILGGIAGAMLAGPKDFIDEARIWQHRQGGRLPQLYPYVLAARKGLRERLGRMEDYNRKAVTIAEILQAFPQIEVLPNPPQTNMMHVFMRGDKAKLEAAALQIAEEQKIWLVGLPLNPTIVPNCYRFELTVGDATLNLPNSEISNRFEDLFSRILPSS